MKFIPSFSLRTLLLDCILFGAAEGVWLKRNVWVRECEIPLPNPEIPFSNLSCIALDTSEQRLLISDGLTLRLIDLSGRKIVWEKNIFGPWNWFYFKARFIGDGTIEIAFLSMGARYGSNSITYLRASDGSPLTRAAPSGAGTNNENVIPVPLSEYGRWTSERELLDDTTKSNLKIPKKDFETAKTALPQTTVLHYVDSAGCQAGQATFASDQDGETIACLRSYCDKVALIRKRDGTVFQAIPTGKMNDIRLTKDGGTLVVVGDNRVQI